MTPILKTTFPCISAFALFGVAESTMMSPLEKLTLDGVLLLIIWYLLTQGRNTLDKFAAALAENTKAVRRMVKRIERVEKIVQAESLPEAWSDTEIDSPLHGTTASSNSSPEASRFC